jgi:protein gp37
MGDTTGISWCDATFNSWIGCTKVSAGCDNCYAEREQDLRYGRAKWGKRNARYRTSESNRRKPFTWDRQAAKDGRRVRVFTASLSDVFDEEVPDQWRDELFDAIRATPNLDWLVLTKRLAKMLHYTQWMRVSGLLPSNVWWGCSVENQKTANQRVPELLKLRTIVGAAPLWLSIEPLITAIDLRRFLFVGEEGGIDYAHSPSQLLDWVIVGGESGVAARPMHPDWPRSLRDQCVAASVAFHFKQHGEWIGVRDLERLPLAPAQITDPYDHFPAYVFADGGTPVFRVGKKAAGRLLDGKIWDEFPR